MSENEPKSGPVPPDLLLQYLVVLAGTDPLVWRRLRVPASYSFWDLHVAIQDAMGWLDYHLHMFRVVDLRSGVAMTLGIPDPDESFDRSMMADWTEFPLDYASDGAPPIQYTYDFGDDWRHAVIFEGYEQAQGQATGPQCVGGAGACPPEDCGGPHGYEALLSALADPEHPQHAELMEWVKGELDPSSFSPDDVEFDDPQERWKVAFEGGAI